MAIATAVATYLRERGARYDVVRHPRTYSSIENAQAAHLPGLQVAKSVILRDDSGGYVMAVLPAIHHVRLGRISRQLGRPLRLASEDELGRLFNDCVPGAIPALGPAYGLETVVDDDVASQPEVYFEAGDHEELIHVSGREFNALLPNARHGQFSHHL